MAALPKRRISRLRGGKRKHSKLAKREVFIRFLNKNKPKKVRSN